VGAFDEVLFIYIFTFNFLFPTILLWYTWKYFLRSLFNLFIKFCKLTLEICDGLQLVVIAGLVWNRPTSCAYVITLISVFVLSLLLLHHFHFI
jgi:hypothetical protein